MTNNPASKKTERVLSLDIGYSAFGWGVRVWGKGAAKEAPLVDYGVYDFTLRHIEEGIGKVADLKRNKRRALSKKKRRKEIVKLILGLGVDEKRFRTAQGKSGANLWKIVERAHEEKISPEEFALILYRFGARRGYIDMRKPRGNRREESEEEKKEKGAIKQSLSDLQKFMEAEKEKGKFTTWFSAVFAKREALVEKTVEKLRKQGAPESVLEEVRKGYPYTNAQWSPKLIWEPKKEGDEPEGGKKPKKKKDKKKKTGSDFPLMLSNKMIAEAVSDLATRQRELGNSHPIFSEETVARWRDIATYRGRIQGTEKLVGMCLSGLPHKRHPKTSIDAERVRVAEFFNNERIVKWERTGKDGEGNDKVEFSEYSFRDMGFGYDGFYDFVLEVLRDSLAEKREHGVVRGTITAGKFVKKLVEKGYLPEPGAESGYTLKKLKKKTPQAKAASAILHLHGHAALETLDERARRAWLENEDFRDAIEFTLMVTRDDDEAEEKVRELLATHVGKEVAEDDEVVRRISDIDTGKPAPCCNLAYRKILPVLAGEESTSFQNALIKVFPGSRGLDRRDPGSLLSFKKYLEEKKERNLPPSPFQDAIIEEMIFVVNRVIQKYGPFDRVVFETSREILSERERNEVMREIRRNEKLSRAAKEYLLRHGSPLSFDKALERLKLYWEQGGSFPTEKGGTAPSAISPVTLEPISIEQALDGEKFDIDHLIPKYSYVNNSRSNKILVEKNHNKNKSKKTHREYLTEKFGEKEAERRIEEFIRQVTEGGKQKKEYRFSGKKKRNLRERRSAETIRQIALGRFADEEDAERFAMNPRMDSETKKAAKIIMDIFARQYDFGLPSDVLTLAEARSRVIPVPGYLTAQLRKLWIPDYEKKRSEYVHHAIDALVLLNVTRSLLQRYATAKRRSVEEEVDEVDMLKKLLYEEREEVLAPLVPDLPAIVNRAIEEYRDMRRVVVRRDGKRNPVLHKATIGSPKEIEPAREESVLWPGYNPFGKKDEQRKKQKRRGFKELERGLDELRVYSVIEKTGKRGKPKEKLVGVRVHAGLIASARKKEEDIKERNGRFVIALRRGDLVYLPGKGKKPAELLVFKGFSAKSNGEQVAEFSYPNHSTEDDKRILYTLERLRGAEKIRRIPINGKMAKGIWEKVKPTVKVLPDGGDKENREGEKHGVEESDRFEAVDSPKGYKQPTLPFVYD